MIGKSLSTRKPDIVDVIRILIAILLPPVGVFLQVGLGLQFWLNILLTLCGYVPGIIHAIWVILRK
nr:MULTISPECIES: YqaE/Pmp3 family membrane protein [Agrobacterium]